jgi:hypothetical protein
MLKNDQRNDCGRPAITDFGGGSNGLVMSPRTQPPPDEAQMRRLRETFR